MNTGNRLSIHCVMGIKLRIEGGNQLKGTIKIDSAKNSVLAILAAVILVDGETVLRNIPKLSDISNMLRILASLGCKVKWSGSDLTLDSSRMQTTDVTGTHAREIRSSIFVLGSILGRFKNARVAYPGGCAIGNRPIDLHIQGLRDLGCNVRERNGFVECSKKRTTGGNVYLDYPSVGATENLIMASVLGNRSTRIINAAREPEVEDMCNFLNTCGAHISGAGTSTITIEGVKGLSGCTYTPIPDRIITGSYLIATAVTGGSVTLTNTIPSHNESLITKLERSGSKIRCWDDKIHIESEGLMQTTKRRKKENSNVTCIQTSPYPGFPTDLQSQMAVHQALSRVPSTITENLFESRFRYVPELAKMGASITVRDRTAIINGVDKLTAADCTATDLRGGVALVIAAMAAEGITIIDNAELIYRGHQAIETDLASVGANIIKLED